MDAKNLKSWSQIQEETWRDRADLYCELDWVSKDDFVHAMIDACKPQSTFDVLDVGTGPGIIAGSISPLVRRVIGIDIVPEMTNKAERSYYHQPNVEFDIGDVQDLKFASDSFDLVTARMVFHHVEDCSRGFSEVFRVLRPGGSLVLCEGVPPDHRVRERYEKIFELKEKRHTFSEAELILFFDEAGFSEICVRPFFMRQVSLDNWLSNGGVEPDAIEEIRRLHIEADDHFKKVYRITRDNNDVLMDWRFCIVSGTKT